MPPYAPPHLALPLLSTKMVCQLQEKQEQIGLLLDFFFQLYLKYFRFVSSLVSLTGSGNCLVTCSYDNTAKVRVTIFLAHVLE